MGKYNEHIDVEDDLQDRIMEQIRTRRKELGMSQNDLALLITGKENNRAFVHRFENGTSGIGLRVLARIANALRFKIILEPEEVY